MEGELSIIDDNDNRCIIVKRDPVNVSIPIVDFALLTIIHLEQGIEMTELCFCYQKDFKASETVRGK